MINFKDILKKRLFIFKTRRYQALIIVVVLTGVAISVLPSLTENTFLEPSTASFSIQDNKLRVSFDITKKDQEQLKEFSDSLGVSTDWAEGIIINLDQDTLAKLNSNLPTTVDLKIGEKEINFSNSSLPSLESALPGNSYEFATSSGNFALKTNGNDVKLIILDPEPLLQYATSSGKFNISSQLQPLFPMLGKIARIELSAKDKNLSGRIILK